MPLEFASLPLAFLAGVLSILSPCVWPLVPAVMAASKSKKEAIAIGLGLSTSFALAGTLLSYALLNLGLDPVIFRGAAAVLLVAVGIILVSERIREQVVVRLSMLTARFDFDFEKGRFGQFGVGMLLGLVWLPCVGPTLGAALALASMGQDMAMAFTVMFTYGIGTAVVLILAAFISERAFRNTRANFIKSAESGKKVLGYILIALGLFVLLGIDKQLETLALELLPGWLYSL